MPQMTIFECQKDKNMTRVKNKVINVKVVLVYIMTLTIVPEILIPQLYIYYCIFKRITKKIEHKLACLFFFSCMYNLQILKH
jgi:hypothetical protein